MLSIESTTTKVRFLVAATRAIVQELIYTPAATHQLNYSIISVAATRVIVQELIYTPAAAHQLNYSSISVVTTKVIVSKSFSV